ncbi:MAG: hypothetical protein WDW36_004968 [Sanguina aurantia]
MIEQGKLPPEVVMSAKGLLMIKTRKIGFGISVTQGYGLLMARLPNTASGWSAPVPIKVDGFSVGAVLGFSDQNTIVCLATDQDLQAFLSENRAMKIGLDFGLVGEKVDKSVAVNTQTGQTDSVTGQHTRSFTISKGKMVDVSVAGTSVEPDLEDISEIYGEYVTMKDLLTGKVSAPREAEALFAELKAVEAMAAG